MDLDYVDSDAVLQTTEGSDDPDEQFILLAKRPRTGPADETGCLSARLLTNISESDHSMHAEYTATKKNSEFLLRRKKTF